MSRLVVHVLGHGGVPVVPSRSHLRAVDLDALPVGLYQDNRLAESRVYWWDGLEQGEYTGLASARWEAKYPDILTPARLDALPLRPEVVWAACPTRPGWLAFSEHCHPGIARLTVAMASWAGLPVRDDRTSFWANNYVCAAGVWTRLLPAWRLMATQALTAWGLNPPFELGSFDQARKVAYLLERATVLWFAAQEDLEVRAVLRR